MTFIVWSDISPSRSNHTESTDDSASVDLMGSMIDPTKVDYDFNLEYVLCRHSVHGCIMCRMEIGMGKLNKCRGMTSTVLIMFGM